MDAGAMDELMYDTLVRYFKTLAHTGYKSYDVVFKMLVIDFIYEITHTELRYYITDKDIKLMQDLLYQFLGSTCEISLPTNNKPCCVCCNSECTTPPPIVPTTTSTRPPAQYVYITLSSTVAKSVYVNDSLVDIGTQVNAEVGSILTISSLDVDGYTFRGFYINGSLISTNLTLHYTVPSRGTTLELRYSPISSTTTTSTTSTTSTTTSSQPPVVGNSVYYGVVKDYMSPFDFRDMPIGTLMERESTKSKTITGTAINEFTIPQNGYFAYLIVPIDKVELQYAAFTSGGITTTYYDSSKPNNPTELDPTPNGAFFSKYTRGGANANQGGSYNGMSYDVYFAYINNGGIPELIECKAKNK